MAKELSPGVTKRRVLPEGGEQKLRDKIHKESREYDNYGNLPFSFGKPMKGKKTILYECLDCGNVMYAPVNTVMIVCPKCKKAAKVKEVTNE